VNGDDNHVIGDYDKTIILTASRRMASRDFLLKRLYWRAFWANCAWRCALVLGFDVL
jgi:hypothetical protein